MSKIAEYDSMDGLGMAELVRTRQLHPRELLDAALERAARWNPHLNALSASFPDRAREAIDRFYRDGRSREQLAAEFEMSLDGVKSLLRRTRTALRDCIERRLGRQPTAANETEVT